MRTSYNLWPVKNWKLTEMSNEAKNVVKNLVSASNGGSVLGMDPD